MFEVWLRVVVIYKFAQMEALVTDSLRGPRWTCKVHAGEAHSAQWSIKVTISLCRSADIRAKMESCESATTSQGARSSSEGPFVGIWMSAWAVAACGSRVERSKLAACMSRTAQTQTHGQPTYSMSVQSTPGRMEMVVVGSSKQYESQVTHHHSDRSLGTTAWS